MSPKPRKRWRTSLSPAYGTQHPSQAAAYRKVRQYAAERGADMLRLSAVNVWVDERDGRGWQLYERVDLDEIVRAERAEALLREARDER